MKKQVFPIILVFITVTLFLSGCTSNNTSASWGDAPDFTLKTLDGDTIKLSDFQGKIVLLDMMGVDCPYCVYMMPILKYISENYSEVVIISVDVYQYETEAYLQSLIDAFKSELNIELDWIFGMDSDGTIASDYVKDGGVPKLIIVDQNGNIYYSFSGYTEYSPIAEKINELLD
jgi:thiol-disulfide isomerase/thioredoxin